jgi:exonuclease III
MAPHIYTINIQGLRGKICEILNFLHPNFSHILCMSEHHLDQFELDTVLLGSYTLGASYCRCSMKKGGVCIYVYPDLSYSKIDLSNFSIDQHIEASTILLSNSFEKIYVVLIYRAPSDNFTIFFKKD